MGKGKEKTFNLFPKPDKYWVLMDLMAGVEIKRDEAMIQALADFSKRNASHVKGILNLTIPLNESPV